MKIMQLTDDAILFQDDKGEVLLEFMGDFGVRKGSWIAVIFLGGEKVTSDLRNNALSLLDFSKVVQELPEVEWEVYPDHGDLLYQITISNNRMRRLLKLKKYAPIC